MEYLQKKLGFRMLFVADAILLVITQITQGVAVNFIFIKPFEEYFTTYFFFALDSICAILFAAAMVMAYRYFTSRQKKDVKTTTEPSNISEKYFFKFNFGDLPLCYISWIVYVGVLIAKLSFMNVHLESHKTKLQIFQACIACSCFVFVFLVEGHNWFKKSTENYSFMSDVGRKVAIEVFDSVEMFFMLLSKDHLSMTLESVIFSLATLNFVLPTFCLYDMSITKFGQDMSSKSFRLMITHTVLRLVLIDIPFFVVRFDLWLTGIEVSMFMMKNLLSIIFTARELFVEIYLHLTNKKPVKNPSKMEEIPLNQTTEETQTDGKTNSKA